MLFLNLTEKNDSILAISYKEKVMSKGLVALLVIVVLVFCGVDQALSISHLELSRQEKEMLTLFYNVTSLATRSMRMVGKTHVATTVLTKRDIERSGARTIEDLLRLVPGIQVAISPVGYPRLYLRGLPNQGAEKIKIFLNGQDLASAISGGAAFFLDHFPVAYVEKMEIIRGPGSSLYGSDALAGVINIVTSPKSVDHTQYDAGIEYGSWDSTRFNSRVLQPLTGGYIMGSAHFFHSNGADVHMSQDALGHSGHTNERQERTDLSLTVKKGPFTLNGYYVNYWSGGYYNPGFYLTDKTRTGWEEFLANVSYKDSFLEGKFTVKERIYFSRYRPKFDIFYRPRGWRSPLGITYPNGIRTELSGYMDHYGTEFVTNLRPYKRHTFTLGVELRQTELHGVSTKANYDPRPLPRVTDVSKRFNWIEPEDRFFWSGFLQYQWDLNDSAYIVGGVRYDMYDDVGDVISPNLGLYWGFKRHLSLSVHFAKGFRAPAFRELYKHTPGPPVIGNPDLKPEEANSLDATLTWSPARGLSLSLTGFYSKIEDLIVAVDREFQNVGNLWSSGLEVSAKIELDSFTCQLQQTYVKSQMDGKDFSGVSNWIGTALLSYDITKQAWISSLIYFVGSSDVYSPILGRKQIDDYTSIDLVLGFKHLVDPKNGPDLSIAVRNLLDEEITFPEVTGVVPEGLKRPGISFDARLSFSF